MRTDQLPTPNGVDAVAKATFDLDLGNLYREIWLRVTCAAGNKTAGELIDDITIDVNGKPARTHTPAELDEIQTLIDSDLAVKTSGSVGTADLISFVPIFLAEDWRKNVERGLGLGWNAIGIRSLQVKVKMLSGWGSWDDADRNRGLGPITKWKRQDLDAVGTPKDFQKVFDVGSQDNFLQSLHLWPTATGTSREVIEAELKLNGGIIHNRTADQNQAVLMAKGMNPSGEALRRYDLVLDESDSINDMINLRGVNKQNLKLTFNGAPNGSLRTISLETGPVE
jgi:hypothetical protein